MPGCFAFMQYILMRCITETGFETCYAVFSGFHPICAFLDMFCMCCRAGHLVWRPQRSTWAMSGTWLAGLPSSPVTVMSKPSGSSMLANADQH